MTYAPANIADAAILLAIAVFARVGYVNGFAESIWSALRWVLIATGGAFSWSPLATELQQRAGLPFVAGAIISYVAVSAGIAWLVAMAQRLYAEQLLLAIPTGPTDGLLGLGSGLVTGFAFSVSLLAILNPLGSDSAEWNPTDLGNDRAITALCTAVFATVHEVVLEQSTVGKIVSESFPRLLIVANGPEAPDAREQSLAASP